MRPVFYLFLPLLLCTCGPAPEETSDDVLPWSEASFLSPIPTPITFVNGGDSTCQFATDLRDYPTYFSSVLPDTLAAGDSVTIVPEISRPRMLFVGLGRHSLLLPVLPGYARTLHYDSMQVMEVGAEQNLYGYLDSALLPLHPMPFYPPEIDALDTYYNTLSTQISAHLDTLSTRPDLPDWLHQMIEREAGLLALGRPFTTRAYRMFFFEDTLAVPEGYLDTIRRILEAPLAYQTPSYNDLQGTYSRYLAESGPHRDAAMATRNYWSHVSALTGDYPAPTYRDDAIAELLTEQIADLRMYDGKAQIIDTLTASLPAAYRQRITAFTDSVAASRKDNGAMQAFLTTPLASGTQGTVTPLEIRSKALTLYKFWFAGCYPCIVQQPAERELMAEHPNLEVVYVAFSTDEERWLPYLEEHDAPASANLYVPRDQTELVSKALGRLGAPTYLLLDDTGEVRCVNCPKPNDPLFASFLE